MTLSPVSLGSQSFGAYIHQQQKQVLHSHLLEGIFLKINALMMCSGTAQTHCLGTWCLVFRTSKCCLITVLSTTLQEIKSQLRIATLLLFPAALLEKSEGLC